MTTVGSEVCRVSVVDQDGKLIYNSLVKPGNRIVDYATAYSGITEELLASVTTTLEDVQRKLTEIIDYDTVIVGHSLNCDLVVLKVTQHGNPRPALEINVPYFSLHTLGLSIHPSYTITQEAPLSRHR